MTEIIYKEESYKIIGICMEVYNELGKGFNEIVYSDALEIKAVGTLSSAHIKQTLNYLAASKLQLGILINFGEDSLNYKRIIL